MRALLDAAMCVARIVGEEPAMEQAMRVIALCTACVHVSDGTEWRTYSTKYANWREDNPMPTVLRDVPAHAAKFVEAMGYVGEHARCAGLFVLWRAWDINKREGGLHQLAELYAATQPRAQPQAAAAASAV